ncbi:MarR family transcriptional regulator [Nakamurella flavida]|uniref:MarR family transcriptional regulator n=1 Tax=Nakamurella flavida TaxID=363630 RepID=A0A938YQU6_9ACTN|nr:MarR family transcriptional regulator [Nakamurella flavida]MBM9477739.1 MarR family transcriptional regulator [Nakamurella flavida]MDP9779291.1 DNA-binding MarR family transcriptional regulator [Nakamurella flavida]
MKSPTEDLRPDPADPADPADCDCASGDGTPSGLSDADACTRWLTGDEQEAWKGAVALALLLPGPLDAQLQRDSGLSLFEYLVLSSLSMRPDLTTAMSDLARLANGSLTRLSNVARRLENRGLMTRRPAPDDGRTTLATLTAAGLRTVQEAAPGHVRAVREVLVDRLDADQLRTLAEIGALLADPAPGGQAGTRDAGGADGPGPSC